MEVEHANGVLPQLASVTIDTLTAVNVASAQAIIEAAQQGGSQVALQQWTSENENEFFFLSQLISSTNSLPTIHYASCLLDNHVAQLMSKNNTRRGNSEDFSHACVELVDVVVGGPLLTLDSSNSAVRLAQLSFCRAFARLQLYRFTCHEQFKTTGGPERSDLQTFVKDFIDLMRQCALDGTRSVGHVYLMRSFVALLNEHDNYTTERKQNYDHTTTTLYTHCISRVLLPITHFAHDLARGLAVDEKDHTNYPLLWAAIDLCAVLFDCGASFYSVVLRSKSSILRLLYDSFNRDILSIFYNEHFVRVLASQFADSMEVFNNSHVADQQQHQFQINLVQMMGLLVWCQMYEKLPAPLLSSFVLPIGDISSAISRIGTAHSVELYLAATPLMAMLSKKDGKSYCVSREEMDVFFLGAELKHNDQTISIMMHLVQYWTMLDPTSSPDNGDGGRFVSRLFNLIEYTRRFEQLIDATNDYEFDFEMSICRNPEIMAPISAFVKCMPSAEFVSVASMLDRGLEECMGHFAQDSAALLRSSIPFCLSVGILIRVAKWTLAALNGYNTAKSKAENNLWVLKLMVRVFYILQLVDSTFDPAGEVNEARAFMETSLCKFLHQMVRYSTGVFSWATEIPLDLAQAAFPEFIFEDDNLGGGGMDTMTSASSSNSTVVANGGDGTSPSSTVSFKKIYKQVMSMFFNIGSLRALITAILSKVFLNLRLCGNMFDEAGEDIESTFARANLKLLTSALTVNHSDGDNTDYKLKRWESESDELGDDEDDEEAKSAGFEMVHQLTQHLQQMDTGHMSKYTLRKVYAALAGVSVNYVSPLERVQFLNGIFDQALAAFESGSAIESNMVILTTVCEAFDELAIKHMFWSAFFKHPICHSFANIVWPLCEYNKMALGRFGKFLDSMIPKTEASCWTVEMPFSFDRSVRYVAFEWIVEHTNKMGALCMHFGEMNKHYDSLSQSVHTSSADTEAASKTTCLLRQLATRRYLKALQSLITAKLVDYGSYARFSGQTLVELFACAARVLFCDYGARDEWPKLKKLYKRTLNDVLSDHTCELVQYGSVRDGEEGLLHTMGRVFTDILQLVHGKLSFDGEPLIEHDKAMHQLHSLLNYSKRVERHIGGAVQFDECQIQLLCRIHLSLLVLLIKSTTYQNLVMRLLRRIGSLVSNDFLATEFDVLMSCADPNTDQEACRPAFEALHQLLLEPSNSKRTSPTFENQYTKHQQVLSSAINLCKLKEDFEAFGH